ncbi:DNA pilot protein [Apis mellifera associated microvirus 56]|nr:DNA pilot protein [Apis mellifera associated microvirus 56]
MGVPASALIGAATSAADIIAGIFTSKANRKSQKDINQANIDAVERNNLASRQWEREQMDYENKINKEWWDMTNAYNSPAAQVERLKAANLNPALLYGSAPQNVAGSLDSAHGSASRGDTAHLQPPTYDKLAIGSLFGSTLQAMQFEMQKKLTDSQVANNVADANKTIASTPADTPAARQALNDQMDKNNAILDANKSKISSETENIEESTKLRKQQGLLNVQEGALKAAKILRERAETQLTGVRQKQVLNAIRSADVQREIMEFELQQRKKGQNPNDPGWYKDLKKLWNMIDLRATSPALHQSQWMWDDDE